MKINFFSHGRLSWDYKPGSSLIRNFWKSVMRALALPCKQQKSAQKTAKTRCNQRGFQKKHIIYKYFWEKLMKIRLRIPIRSVQNPSSGLVTVSGYQQVTKFPKIHFRKIGNFRGQSPMQCRARDTSCRTHS